jgi:hypothetical protein
VYSLGEILLKRLISLQYISAGLLKSVDIHFQSFLEGRGALIMEDNDAEASLMSMLSSMTLQPSSSRLASPTASPVADASLTTDTQPITQYVFYFIVS